MSHLVQLLVRYSPVLLLSGSAASAQTVQPVFSVGNPFLGFTVDSFEDIAVGDGGEWFAAVSTTPQQGTPLTVIHRGSGPDGVFTPGLVANLSGAASTLVNLTTVGDFFHVGNTITVTTSVTHGLQVGERVRLDFLSLYPGSTGPLPADGFFTVQSVPNSAAFTITHGTAGNCGSLPFSPCGKVNLLRTIQAADLNYSLTCLPAYQGVLQMMDDDNLGTSPLITPTINDSGLFWNSTVLLREGQFSNAPQVTPGTTPYTRIYRSAVDSRQDYLLLARMDDPAITGTEEALVFVDVTASCPPSVQSEQVLVRTGDVILNTNNLRFGSFRSLEKRSFRINESGDFMYLAALNESNGMPSAETSVVVDNVAVLSVSSQVPGLTGQITDLSVAAVDLNDLGDYVAQVKMQTSPHGVPCVPQPPPGWCNPPPPPAPQRCPTVYCFPFAVAIVKGHRDTGNVTKFIQAGDSMPDTSVAPGEIMLRVGTKIPPLQPLTDPLMVFPVLLTNGGDVIWYGEWGHLDGSGAEVTVGKGIFFNKKVIVQTSQPPAPPNNAVLDIGVSTTDVRAAMEVSPNGRYLLFRGLYGNTNSQSVSLLQVDLGESVPYGTVVQSTGGTGCTYGYPTPSLDCTPGILLPGTTTFGDFPLVGHNLQVVATSAPAGTVTALFAFKTTPHSNFPCGSGPPIEILLGSGSSTNFLVPYSGSAVLSNPISSVLLGNTWYCQAFFRNAANQTIGATNAIRFVFGAP